MREALIEALGRAVVAVPSAKAAWIGGSEAFGRQDAQSDVDLVVVCERSRGGEVFAAVEAALDGRGGIEARWELPPGFHPDYDQRFYRPAGAPETLMVDLCVMWPDRVAPYMDPDRHGTPRVLFDREDLLRPSPDESLAPVFRDRLVRLRARHELIGHIPAKNLERGHLIEAVDSYQRLLLWPLVEVLRARWCPKRQDFALRYLHHDLPLDVHEPLAELFLVRDAEDLGRKIGRARGWLDAELRDAAPEGGHSQ